jgi:hypothetical protein
MSFFDIDIFIKDIKEWHSLTEGARAVAGNEGYQDVIRLGIEAAKLGLRVEDLAKMARLYHALKASGLSDFDMDKVQYFLRVVRAAN